MIKSLFSALKKTAVTVLYTFAILIAVGIRTTSVVNVVTRSTSIGTDEAEVFAFADAGVGPITAENVRTEFDFERGHSVYDVESTASETEYDY